MSIPSQLPQLVTAARAGALQALALQAGQVVEGKVLGAASNGGTQVEIKGQLLNLLLPVATKPGTMIQFEVQGSGAQAKLAMHAPAGVVPTPVLAAAAPAQGATVVQVSAQAATPMPAPGAAIAAPQQGAPAASAVAASVAGSVAPTPQAAVAQPQPPIAPTIASVPQAAAPAGQTTAAVPAPALPGAPAGMPPAVPVAAAQRAAGRPQGAVFYPTTSVARTTPVAANPAPVGGAPGMAAPPTAAPSVAATPQAALAQMVQAALPRQHSVAALNATVAAVLGKVPLPEPVVRAARQVLAGQLDLGTAKLEGATLQRAVLRSGVFQEASLARGTPVAAADAKTALLALRQTLTTWLGGQQAPVQAAAQVAPPLRGSVPRARAGEAPAAVDPAAAPEEAGRQLLARTEAALSRLRLHQHASLPDPSGRQSADWSMDLPVLVAGHQTVMQLQIHRDAPDEGKDVVERGWQMRFALNLPGLGEVGAQVSLRGGATGVMLWASEPETAAALEADLGDLREGLAATGLRPGAVIVRQGAPPEPRRPAAEHHLVDATR